MKLVSKSMKRIGGVTTQKEALVECTKKITQDGLDKSSVGISWFMHELRQFVHSK